MSVYPIYLYKNSQALGLAILHIGERSLLGLYLGNSSMRIDIFFLRICID